MRKFHHHSGFSLVEMMIVLALIGLFAAISLPYNSGAADRTRLLSVSRALAARFTASRAQAVFENAPLRLQIDPSTRNIVDATGRMLEAIPSDFTIAITSAQEESIAGESAIIFFADGGSTGGSVLLSKGSISTAIKVNWLSGASVVEISP